MDTLKVFLASSSELESDRKEFELFIGRKNKKLINKGSFIELILWEDFIDAMSPDRLQGEYDQAVKNCDIFVMLFFTKVGKYTEEEFETAFGQFKDTNKPLIYTYFKDSEIRAANVDRADMKSVWRFMDKLDDLGHFYTKYQNIDDLKFKFNDQLDKLLETIPVNQQNIEIDQPEQITPLVEENNAPVHLVSNQQDWQKKLIKKLTAQMQLSELKGVVNDFFNELEDEYPNLEKKAESVAEYLVTGQDKGDQRRIIILQFLQVAEQYIDEQPLIEPIYKLLAYLLQTLVIKCKDEVNGLTKIPVERMQTVELINATRVSNSFVPYANENLEFKNGQRNSRLENVGDYQPPTGEMDELMVCQEIAKGLLKTLGESNVEDSKTFKVLNGRLSRYDLDPGKSRLQGIQIHQNLLAQHPFSVPSIVERFTKMTRNKLPIYIYGTQEGDDAQDWLHIEEEEIRGLIVEENKIVENFNAIKKQIQKPREASIMKDGINVGNIGDNATVSIVTGEQKESIVGTGNIQLSKENIMQLQEQLQQILQEAANADDVGKPEYAALTQAASDIETEIQKNQNADKNVLTKAMGVLEGFKNIASIAGSIEKITTLLLPFVA